MPMLRGVMVAVTISEVDDGINRLTSQDGWTKHIQAEITNIQYTLDRFKPTTSSLPTLMLHTQRKKIFKKGFRQPCAV